VFIPKYCEVGTGVSFDAGMSGGVTTRVAIARMAAERGESKEDMFFSRSRTEVEGGRAAARCLANRADSANLSTEFVEFNAENAKSFRLGCHHGEVKGAALIALPP
jgi:hypothetical protein